MNVKQFIYIIALSFAICSCDKDELNNQSNNSEGYRNNHVILIGLDGWGSYSLSKANMPVVKSLMNQGAFTLHKRSVLPSASAINWASLYMGVPPEIHGYLNWNSKEPEIKYSFPIKNNIFPTIFQILKEQRPLEKSTLFYSWEGIKYLVDTLSISEVVFVPNLESIDDAKLFNQKVREHIILEKPRFCNVYYSEPDETGHKYGFQSEEFYDKIQLLDSFIGEVIQATKDAGIFNNTIFVITSDHGGVDKQHGGRSLLELESPLIIYGPNVKKGEIEGSVMQYDIGATIAWVLGLDIPSLWIGRPLIDCFQFGKRPNLGSGLIWLR